MRDLIIRLLRPLRFPGRYRLLQAISPNRGERTVELFGYTIRLDLGDFIQRCMYLGVYEEHETSLVSAYLQRGMTFVDAGANVGYYSLMAASIVGPTGTVLAFEPSPYAFERLARTLKMNNVSQVRAFQAGLGDETGDVALYVQREAGNHTPSMVPHEDRDAVSVPVQTLDRCLEQNGIQRVDLLKIDVEGYEPNVLRGAANTMRAGNVRAILCELNLYGLGVNGSSPHQLHDTFIRHGYQTAGRPFDPNAGYQNLFYVK